MYEEFSLLWERIEVSGRTENVITFVTLNFTNTFYFYKKEESYIHGVYILTEKLCLRVHVFYRSRFCQLSKGYKFMLTVCIETNSDKIC